MRVIRHYQDCPESMHHGVVALGNFDGIHRGHKAVIGTAQSIAKERGTHVSVMSFEPHPAHFFNPDLPRQRITPFRQKAQIFKKIGIDTLFAQHFSRVFAALTAEQFIEDVLHAHLKAAHIVIGYDFIFGHGRKGNIALLQEYATRFGFGLTQVEAVGEQGNIFSSSAVRDYIRQGAMERVAQMLGRPYTIYGKVQKGEQRGRLLGYPTANIALKRHIHPLHGVYVVELMIDGAVYPGVANFGRKPTFGSKEPLLEVYLLDIRDIDLYNKRVEVAMLDFIRPEAAFASLDALKEQIAHDCSVAHHYFSQRNSTHD